MTFEEWWTETAVRDKMPKALPISSTLKRFAAYAWVMGRHQEIDTISELIKSAERKIGWEGKP